MAKRDTPPKDDTEYMRRELEDIFWNIAYQEEELQKAHRVVAAAKAMLLQGGYDFTMTEAYQHFCDGDGDIDVDDPPSPLDWVKALVGGAVSSVRFHETELAQAHTNLALIKAVIVRANYVFDFGKIEQEARERLAA